MPGGKWFSFREGDRVEYLALYLLSSFGLVTPVPRQEDIGVDFNVLIADQESGHLTYGYPFLIQTKTSNCRKISYGNLTKSGRWKQEEIYWLFRHDNPLFIGLIDVDKVSLRIYQTTPLWFIWRESIDCGKVSMVFGSSEVELGRPQKREIKNRKTNHGDGYEYIVNLGPPIIDASERDLSNKDKLRTMKNILRDVIVLELMNISYRRSALPFFQWTLSVNTNENTQPAYIYYDNHTEEHEKYIINNITPYIVSLALNYERHGYKRRLELLKPMFELIPDNNIPKNVKEKLPEVFNERKGNNT